MLDRLRRSRATFRTEDVSAVILDAAPEGFDSASPVDPRALGGLLADLAGIDGRHVIVADAAGEHRLWLRDPRVRALIPFVKGPAA